DVVLDRLGRRGLGRARRGSELLDRLAPDLLALDQAAGDDRAPLVLGLEVLLVLLELGVLLTGIAAAHGPPGAAAPGAHLLAPAVFERAGPGAQTPFARAHAVALAVGEGLQCRQAPLALRLGRVALRHLRRHLLHLAQLPFEALGPLHPLLLHALLAHL